MLTDKCDASHHLVNPHHNEGRCYQLYVRMDHDAQFDLCLWIVLQFAHLDHLEVISILVLVVYQEVVPGLHVCPFLLHVEQLGFI